MSREIDWQGVKGPTIDELTEFANITRKQAGLGPFEGEAEVEPLMSDEEWAGITEEMARLG